MNGVTTHDHCGVLGVSQERDGPRIRDRVNSTHLNVDLEANIGEVLGLCSPALNTL